MNKIVLVQMKKSKTVEKEKNIEKTPKKRKIKISNIENKIPKSFQKVPPIRKKRNIYEKEKEIYDADSCFSCIICETNTFDCLIMPCQHVLTCYQCAQNLKTCPYLDCKKEITYLLKIKNNLFK